MDLKLSLSNELLNKLNITTYSYAVAFDIAHQKYVDGLIVVDDNNIFVLNNNELVKKHSIKDFDHYRIDNTISGGLLIGSRNGKDEVIIEFSKHYFEKVSSIALGLELYLKEGYFIGSDIAEKHCPKCHTPYVEGSTFCPYCGKGRNSYKKFVPHLLKYKWLIVLTLFIILIMTGVDTYIPKLYKYIVNTYLNAQHYDNNFITMIILLIALSFVQVITNIARSVITPSITQGIVSDIRIDTYKKVQDLSLASANKKTTGSLITIVSRDTNIIANFLSNYVLMSVSNLIKLIVVLLIMFIANPILATFVIVPLPIIIIALRFIFKKVNSKYERQWKALSSTNGALHDILNGIKVVKSYGKETQEINRFKKYNEGLRNVEVEVNSYWATVNPFLNLLFGLATILVYYFIGSSILGRDIFGATQMTLGDMIQWASYTGMIFNCTGQLMNFPQRYKETAISAGKIADLLNEETNASNGNVIENNLSGSVEFDSVRFGYISFTPVLKDLSFKVNPGETIGIVGYSGSGKTTLVNLIMKLYEPNHGRIIVDGMDISKVDSYTYRKKLGVVLQETFIFSGTIYDNITYGADNATYDDVIRVCKMCKAHDFIINKPFGYDTKLGTKGEGLSGGEKQRIAIARVLLINPSIFIFDEATSSLDTITEKEIQESISEISKNKTTFIIAHRLSTLKDADKLIVLNKGKMVEFGSHEELIAQKGYYYSLVEAQYMNYEKKD